MKPHFSAHLAFALCGMLSAMFIPHVLLAERELYFPKLRVDTQLGGEFLIGLAFALFFLLLLMLSLAITRCDRVALRESILAIERRGSFRVLMFGLTGLLIVLLAAGIGAKQSTNSLNFVIRLFPREMVLIIATIAALATRRWLWIGLVVTNIAYWALVGSKGSVFLVALSLLFFWVFERGRIRLRHLFWSGVLAIGLPLSFSTAMAFRLGLDPMDFVMSLLRDPESTLDVLNRILTRVSWFDGMQLTAEDALPLQQFRTLDFIKNAVARLLPGVNATQDPFGQQVIYLFNATSLENFSGAIGMPGVFKIFHYNHGIPGVAALSALLIAYFFGIGKMMVSRAPTVALIGYSVFIVSISSLVISGNVDSAIGKIIPIVVSGILMQYLTRSVFRGLAPRRRHD